MPLKIYESLDFSKHISITKELPLYKKLCDDIPVDMILSELENYVPENYVNGEQTRPWFSVYDNTIRETQRQAKVREALEELEDVGFNLYDNYTQKQLTKYQTTFPWQNWADALSNSVTKTTFENFLEGYSRPRYVEAKPGWRLTTHRDWHNSSRYGLRCHLMLETNDECKHYITDDDGVEHELHFAPGEVWFYNVEKPHRACNLGDTVRKSLSFELVNDDLL